MAQQDKSGGRGNSGREAGGRRQRDNLGRTSPGTSDIGGQRSAGQGRGSDLENRNIGQQGRSGSSKSKQGNQFEDEDELSQGFRTGDQM